MGLPIEIDLRVMVAWNKKYLALKEVVEGEHDFFEGGALMFFGVGFVGVIAIDDISSYDAIIKVESVAADIVC